MFTIDASSFKTGTSSGRVSLRFDSVGAAASGDVQKGRGSILGGSTGVRPLAKGAAPATAEVLTKYKDDIDNESFSLYGHTFSSVRVSGWIDGDARWTDGMCCFTLRDETGTLDVIMGLQNGQEQWMQEQVIEPALKAATPSPSGLLNQRILIHGTVGLNQHRAVVIRAQHIRSCCHAEGFIYLNATLLKLSHEKELEQQPKQEQHRPSPGIAATPSVPLVSGNLPSSEFVKDFQLSDTAKAFVSEFKEETERFEREALFKAVKACTMGKVKVGDQEGAKTVDVLEVGVRDFGVDLIPALRGALGDMQVVALEQSRDYDEHMSSEEIRSYITSLMLFDS